jgi:hypothetical protein
MVSTGSLIYDWKELVAQKPLCSRRYVWSRDSAGKLPLKAIRDLARLIALILDIARRGNKNAQGTFSLARPNHCDTCCGSFSTLLPTYATVLSLDLSAKLVGIQIVMMAISPRGVGIRLGNTIRRR